MEQHTGVQMSDAELEQCVAAEKAAFRSPIPTQVVSSGEYNPMPQTKQQARVENLIMEMADTQGRRHNMDRRRFLTTSAGMATAFLAMNKVFGPIFDVTEAQAADVELSESRRKLLSNQFIFDVHTHFVRDDFTQDGLLALPKWAAETNVNPTINSVPMNLQRLKFDNYLKEIFLDSDTKMTILTGAPFDDPSWLFLSNDQIRDACRAVNHLAGRTRMLGHAVFSPKYPNWMEEVDRVIETLHPASWKGYTIGDPFGPSKFAWNLDDEALAYPFYEKIVKAGINTVCIHKGLMPRDYEKKFAGTWQHAKVDDLGKAAKDWPQINFVIYHAALRPWLGDPVDAEMAEFERSGYLPWSTDLARIPEKFGVTNVYADLGSTFGSTCVTNPRFCAAFLGQLVNLMGSTRVVWGTDCVYYGSPQWQIEALRRLEIPEDMMKKQGWKIQLGGPNSEVKQNIFGLNSARLYNLDMKFGDSSGPGSALATDRLAEMRQEYERSGGERSNTYYGYVAKRALA